MILGGYVQGGFKGATKETLRRPHLTKFLNEFLRDHLEQQGLHGRPLLCTIIPIGLHRDMRNEPQSQNFVMQLTDRLEGGLWISDSTLGEPVDMLLPTGHEQEGSKVSIDGQAVGFDPRKWHCLVPAVQHVWVIAGYTPRGVLGLPEQTRKDLQSLGFKFPSCKTLASPAGVGYLFPAGRRAVAAANSTAACSRVQR